MATRRSTIQFIDQEQMKALVNQSQKSRSRDVDAQFQVLDSPLDQVSEDLERAQGDKDAPQDSKQKIADDRNEVYELRRIVTRAEYNLQRQERTLDISWLKTT